MQVRDPELKGLLGEARFFSITYRLFKLEGVETTCEDYGQAARYKVLWKRAALSNSWNEGYCRAAGGRGNDVQG